MNFKLLIALIALPLSVMAQNRTNEFDNVLINRGLTFKGGTPGLNKVLTSDAAGNYTPQTISAIDPTSLTNVTTSATGFSWTGQGTKVMDLGVNFAIIVTNGGTYSLGPYAVTNGANNFFVSSVTNTVNGSLSTSNLVLMGGMTINRKVVSANYTNLPNDYYIAWSGTTSAQPTNFLATGSASGKTYIIKDSQRSSSTTNIIIKPLSTDTIMGTNFYPLNINGQSISITYDGTSNWEIY